MSDDKTTALRWEVGQVWGRGEYRWRVDAVHGDLAILQSLTTSWARTTGVRLEDNLRDGWVLVPPAQKNETAPTRWELGQEWARGDCRMRVTSIDDSGLLATLRQSTLYIDPRPFLIEDDSRPLTVECWLNNGWKPVQHEVPEVPHKDRGASCAKCGTTDPLVSLRVGTDGAWVCVRPQECEQRVCIGLLRKLLDEKTIEYESMSVQAANLRLDVERYNIISRNLRADLTALQQQLEAVNERICIPRNSTWDAQLNAIIALHEKYEEVMRQLRGRPAAYVGETQRALDKAIRSLDDVRAALGVPEGESLTSAARGIRAELVARRASVEQLTRERDNLRTFWTRIVTALGREGPVGVVPASRLEVVTDHAVATAERLTKECNDALRSSAPVCTLHATLQRELNEARAVQTTLRSLLDVINAQLHLPASATWETTLSALKAERRAASARLEQLVEDCINIAQEEAREGERRVVIGEHEYCQSVADEGRAISTSARSIERKIRALAELKR